MSGPGGAVREGPRLRLRPPTDADLPPLYRWFNDPDTVAPFDRYSGETFEAFRAAVRAAPGDPASLAPRFVVERTGPEPQLLGGVGYYRAHPVLELLDIWYVLGAVTERGKGFGREAVGLLVDLVWATVEIGRIGATCDVANLPSARLLEALGFAREGTIRRGLFHHGAWHDVALYGLIRPDRAGPARPG